MAVTRDSVFDLVSLAYEAALEPSLWAHVAVGRPRPSRLRMLGLESLIANAAF